MAKTTSRCTYTEGSQEQVLLGRSENCILVYTLNMIWGYHTQKAYTGGSQTEPLPVYISTLPQFGQFSTKFISQYQENQTSVGIGPAWLATLGCSVSRVQHFTFTRKSELPALQATPASRYIGRVFWQANSTDSMPYRRNIIVSTVV